MAIQFFIIFGCLALGELIVWTTGIKFPSSIIGMLLLTSFLKLGWVKLGWIKQLSDFLISNLGFFFCASGSCYYVVFGYYKARVIAYSIGYFS